MPRVRTWKTKKPPKGFQQVQPVLFQFQQRIRDVQSIINDAVLQNTRESLSDIIKLHHEKSRYFYQLFYKKKQIQRPLYQFLLEQKYIDGALIAKWKKQGYQKLCCLNCIQKKQQNYQGTCICRVPQKDLQKDKIIMCHKCGCRGCASSD